MVYGLIWTTNTCKGHLVLEVVALHDLRTLSAVRRATVTSLMDRATRCLSAASRFPF